MDHTGIVKPMPCDTLNKGTSSSCAATKKVVVLFMNGDVWVSIVTFLQTHDLIQLLRAGLARALRADIFDVYLARRFRNVACGLIDEMYKQCLRCTLEYQYNMMQRQRWCHFHDYTSLQIDNFTRKRRPYLLFQECINVIRLFARKSGNILEFRYRILCFNNNGCNTGLLCLNYNLCIDQLLAFDSRSKKEEKRKKISE